MNNWFVTMDGVKAVTGSDWSRLYFLFFYFFGVLVIFNLVVATVINAYNARRQQLKTMKSAVKRVRINSHLSSLVKSMVSTPRSRLRANKSKISNSTTEDDGSIGYDELFLEADTLATRESSVYDMFSPQ